MLVATVALVSGCAQLGLGNGAVEMDETRRTWCYEHAEAIAREWLADDEVVHDAALFEWPITPTAAPGRTGQGWLDTARTFVDWEFSEVSGVRRVDLDEAAAVFRKMAPSAYSVACQRAWDHR
jgi:hypothetical protein